MEDLISRQAAIDEIMKCRFVVDAIEKIRGLPSTTCDDCIWHVCNYNTLDWDLSSTQAENYAQGFADGYKRGMKDAERPKGHWIENDSDTWVCSECGVENAYAVYRGRICDNYCPHCGADMRGE